MRVGELWVYECTHTASTASYILSLHDALPIYALVNAAGGTLNLASSNATPLSFYTGSAAFSNLGTRSEAEAAALQTLASIVCRIVGVVNVAAGSLLVAVGGSDSGVYAVDAAAR